MAGATILLARDREGQVWAVTESAREREIPYIISLDDHVIEPPNVWQDRLPAKYRDVGPRVVRDTYSVDWVNGNQVVPQGWRRPHHRLVVVRGPRVEPPDARTRARATRRTSGGWARSGSTRCGPGCYDAAARVADMELNHVEASLCFPTYPRFAGQMFGERSDRDLALLVRACLQRLDGRRVGRARAAAA